MNEDHPVWVDELASKLHDAFLQDLYSKTQRRLIPFDELPENAKNTWRVVALESQKFFQKRGGR